VPISEDRRWDMPLGKLNASNDPSHKYGGEIPIMYIHLNNQRIILETLLRMGLMYREYGDRIMLAGETKLRRARHSQILVGETLPEPTQIDGLNPVRSDSSPIFYMALRPN
jgi:hypothetical protein